MALEQIHAVAEEFVTLLSESAIRTQPTRRNDVWCIDNGATTHICHDKSSFLELTRTVNQKVSAKDPISEEADEHLDKVKESGLINPDHELSDRTHLILAFSLPINWKRLTKTDSSPDTLTIIHGIRLFTMGWITITHQFFIYTEVSAINRDVIISGDTFWAQKEQYASMLSFGNLLVTGTRHCACPASPRRRLTCQSSRALSVLFSRVSESSSGGFEPLFPAGPVDRRMQLTPAFAAMILLQVGVLPRLGSGPMFGGMYNKTINACDQYWWAALLYFHNFLKPKNMPVVIVGWVGNILMMLAAQYLIYPIQQPDYVYDRLVCSFYFALFRTCWALGVAWIVFACVTGYGAPFVIGAVVGSCILVIVSNTSPPDNN
uniref:Uncharacterized protein n=1 Tax=Timema douglasi TaxID=61478 RepID=A0A7R8Z9T1_TIMDO|nr:unnamed protein product [Timema douglasi]